MINNTIPLGISPKAWSGNSSRQKLLCQMEERFPGNSFYRLLLDCPAFEIKAGLGRDLAFVAVDTAFPENFRAHWVMAGWVLQTLANPFVRAVATRNPLCIGDDGKVRPVRGSDSAQTVVVDAAHQMAYVFEAGQHYIRLLTARSVERYPFIAKKGASVMKVWSDGLTISKNISEVQEAP